MGQRSPNDAKSKLIVHTHTHAPYRVLRRVKEASGQAGKHTCDLLWLWHFNLRQLLRGEVVLDFAVRAHGVNQRVGHFDEQLRAVQAEHHTRAVLIQLFESFLR